MQHPRKSEDRFARDGEALDLNALRIVREPQQGGIRWRLFGSVIVLVGLFAAVPWVLERINPRPGSYRPQYGRYGSPFTESLSFSAWIILFCALIGAALLRFLLGAEKFNEVGLRCIKWIFDRPKRDK
jgi:hypothetical protein